MVSVAPYSIAHRLAGARAFLRGLLPGDGEALDLASGLRAASACAVPVLVGEILDMPDLSWIAIVAFWGCLADNGGAWRARLVAMASFTGLASVSTILALIVQVSPVGAVGFALLVAFVGSFARVYGNAPGTIGNLVVVEFLVCLGLPAAGPYDIALRAGLTLAGGAWAMLLVLFLWRLHPHAPARRSVAQVWHAVSQIAESLARLHEHEATDSAWGRENRQRRRAARDAIEAARQVLASRRRRESGRSVRGDTILLLLADADEAFEALIALSELLQGGRAAAGRGLRRALRVTLGRIATGAEGIAELLAEGKTRRRFDLTRPLELLRRRVDAEAGGAGARHAVELVHKLSEAMALARETAVGVETSTHLARAVVEPITAKGIDWGAVWTATRSNLTSDSLTLRHAARFALTIAIAQATVSIFDISRGYWVVITCAIVLQPFLAATWRRTMERVLGSIGGSLAVALIGLIATSPLDMAIAVFPLSIIAVSLRQVNYGLFTFWVTPQFILIAELFQTGTLGGWDLAIIRVLDSLLGGALGLAAALLFWPSRELPQLPRQIARAVKENGDYLLTALGGGGREAVRAIRPLAGLASNNAEASLDRLIGEPRLKPPPEAEPAMTAITCARGLAGIAAALTLMPDLAPESGLAAAGQPFRAWVKAAIGRLAVSLRDGRRPIPLGAAPEIEAIAPADPTEELIKAEWLRAARQIEMLDAAVNRLAEALHWRATTDADKAASA